MKRIAISALSLLVATTSSYAADTPTPGSGDSRVRYVTYSRDQVTSVGVHVGTVSRIILGDDERIQVSASGMSADCQNPDSLWCIRADIDTHEIWVKPKPGARRNNLEVRTDKRDYSIEFVVDPAANGSRATPATMYRVMYRYPIEIPTMAAFMAQTAAVPHMDEAAVLSDRLATKPIPKNWKYSQKAKKGSDDIKPTLVFDDGRFTYFRFAGNQEVPTIFYVDPAGDESRINYHMDDDLAVVERTGKRFVLRLGASVVGIWNEAFNPDGSGSPAGTTVIGVERKVVP
ncbi:TrbG/VirB9 family P-type conjugative transfer protein [Asticcacaulis benevestitus]|uniref:Conjugal transfer protein TrbG n=1 Tax=Asticcacaulis benevestitus DSM 16100 = ATCC BAA-896 TaxID=1121022 RepID=V4PF41_9CAUL|nr:TrbG/VirB9 family P-type conjugative transfer protein [Asticcacaulis benevestitus]ESQ92562.1 hypothetical protein ABENE_07955 [Asticcacaulis benevestitus DSM 16100 = ATCC BAA-896]